MTNQPARIGIDARLIAYRDGGIAEYTRRLIVALRDLDHESRYVILEGRRAPKRDTIQSGNFRYQHTLTPCHHRYERTVFGIEIAPHRLDLLHSPDFIPPRFGARHRVITIHDLNFLYYPQFQTPDSARYYNGQIRAAVRDADHILADSTATKTDLITLLGVAESKITVHLLGVNPVYRPLSPDQIQAFLSDQKLPAGYLLHVGTLEPRKNLPGLFAAYKILRERLPDLPPLVVVGRRGWLYEPIFESVRTLGLTDYIIFREDVAPDLLPMFYNGAACLVMPSFYEGFGFPPLEAMACGVPTVVSDRASLPEVVGESGALIDPDRPESIAHALYLALTDSAWRARSRASGLARAALFTWERTAQTTLDIYRTLLAR